MKQDEVLPSGLLHQGAKQQASMYINYIYIFSLNFQFYKEKMKHSKILQLECYWGKEDDYFIF